MRHCLQAILMIVIFVLIGIAPIYAQNVSSTALWPLNSTTTTSVQIGGQIIGTSELLRNLSGASAYTGLNGSQLLNYFPGGVATNWPANMTGPIDTVYTQFKVSPNSNYNLIIDSVVLSLAGSGGSYLSANLYYSKDTTFVSKTAVSYATSSSKGPQYLNTAKLDTVRCQPSVAVNQGEVFIFRVYPWNNNQPTGSKKVCLQNVTIYATALPLPSSASATWPLVSNGSASAIGILNAGDVTFDGVNLYHYGYNADGARWTNHLPSDGAWPAESSPNFARYAQFQIAPQVGGTFFADTIRFTQVAELTSTLRMSVYISKDTTFSAKTFVADTTVPTTKAVYEYVISEETIPTGQTLYLRFYPYNTNADPAAKYIDISNVTIAGKTTGVAMQLPTVTTTGASYVSAAFLTSGGNVTGDGGGSVTARGVCWSTSHNPTIANGITTDGSGIGYFTSSVTGLTPGTQYYIRAYATNAAGTGYGSEISATTLGSVVVPTVTTNVISNIMVTTATSGGNVTAWGGASVTAKGVCWNTTGSPTISDPHSTDGTDIGSFSSALSSLTASAFYYVRAYATNSAGAGYGNEVTFTTQVPAPDTTVVVAQDGSGNYTTVQAAFTAVPSNYTGQWTIFVKKGKYREKVTLAAGKVNVVLEGEERDSTVIWTDSYAETSGGTNNAFTIAIDANDFIAKNITFANTYWPNRYGTVSGTQGVALRTQGDRHQYINCVFDGYQDTYYTYGGSGTGRMYHKNCIIRGTTDFIFGRNICVFDSCLIFMMRSSTITAASTDASSRHGYVFRNCKVLADSTAYADSTGFAHSVISSFTLGRPWGGAPRVVLMKCYEPAALSAAGWTSWNVVPGLYGEYACYGAGALTSRTPISGWASVERQLTHSEAAAHSLTNIFARNSANSTLILYDWMPSYATIEDDMPIAVSVEQNIQTNSVPKEYVLNQNYPNPFNPTTTISYSVETYNYTSLRVYDVLGREVATLVNSMQQPGSYSIPFNASHLAGGVYFARLQAGSFNQTIKLVLTK